MRYSLFVPLLASLLPGCKPQEPVYATDKNLGDEGQPLMPTGMYFVYDEELAHGRVGEPDLSNINVPDVLGESGLSVSDVRAIRDTLTEAIGVVADGEWEQLPDYFIEEQAEEIEKFIPILKPLMVKFEELQGVVDAEAAAAAAEASGMPTDPKAIMAMIKPLVGSAEITASDRTHASMKLTLPMPGGAVDLPFVNTDGEWYVAIPNFPEPQALEAIRSGIQQGLPALLAKIDQLIAQGKEQPLSPLQVQMGLLPALMPIQQSVMQAVMQAAAADGDGGAAPERSSAPSAADPVNLDFEAGDGGSGVPRGWIGVGEGYEKSTDADIVHGGSGSGRIKYVGPDEPSFATLAQPLPVDKYKGKRVRLSGYLRTESVSVHAGLGMFAEGSAGQFLANDSMRNHSVTGTSEWKSYEIILDIPEKVRNLSFGAMLSGTGSLWIDDLEIQIVEE